MSNCQLCYKDSTRFLLTHFICGQTSSSRLQKSSDLNSHMKTASGSTVELMSVGWRRMYSMLKRREHGGHGIVVLVQHGASTIITTRHVHHWWTMGGWRTGGTERAWGAARYVFNFIEPQTTKTWQHQGQRVQQVCFISIFFLAVHNYYLRLEPVENSHHHRHGWRMTNMPYHHINTLDHHPHSYYHHFSTSTCVCVSGDDQNGPKWRVLRRLGPFEFLLF